MNSPRKRIAFCGTRGLPANYGGFETAVDEITKRFVVNGFECDVFTRANASLEKIDSYEGRNVIYVEGSKKKKLDTFVSSIQTGIYLLKHRHEYDYVFWFNNANILGILLTILTGIPFSVNTDGLEWRRAKWSLPFKAFYLISSLLISRLCKSLISDSIAIQAYYRKYFKKKTTFIAYGVPKRVNVEKDREDEILHKYDLQKNKYFLQITRFEPDNLPLEVANQFIQFHSINRDFKLVLVGFKDETPYSLKIKELSGKNDVVVLNAIYDQEILTVLRENAFCYVHGNSVGGTNPALLEAMNSCKRVMAIEGPFSREVLGQKGLFFDPKNISPTFLYAIDANEQSTIMRKRIQENYDWSNVSREYIKIAQERSKKV